MNPIANEKKDIFDRLMALPFLRIFNPLWKRYREALLYLFFGGLTTVISIGSFAFFIHVGIGALIANVFSWILVVLFAYITNSIWVFSAKPSGLSELIRQMTGFFEGRVATLLMEEAVLFIGINLLGFPVILVKIAAQILVLIGNYIISKVFVFRKRKDPA